MKQFLFCAVLWLLPSLVLAEDINQRVVILLDTSSSMNESMRARGPLIEKMKAAQDSIVSVLDDVPEDTELGLMTFNGWVYPLGKVNRGEFKKAVLETTAYGGTPLGEYMEAAANALLAAREKNHNYGVYKLLVVTDGEASDPGLLEHNLPDILRRGIVLDTIGVDMGSDHTLSRSSHRYMSADDPASLRQALSVSLAEIADDGQDQNDDFALLEAIPDEVASTIIDKLTNTENQAIGEKPGAAAVPTDAMQNVTVNSGTSTGFILIGVFTVVLLIALLIFIATGSN